MSVGSELEVTLESNREIEWVFVFVWEKERKKKR